ncbi:Ankyrin repeat and zinc finger domain-containing 1, partial [Paramuricea clavata]
RGHFKLDWHKYNIKQRLLLRDPVNEDVFEEMISGELSSISGSESDSAEEVLTTGNPESIPLMTLSILPDERKIHTEVDRSNPKVYFVNESGIHMSLFREVVYGTKEMLTCEEIESRIQNLSQEKFWLILMTGGGHFAGAVFSGNDVVVSKTFHRYTVRAKRGTAQGIRDNKQGGHAPRSAGASLRRYNEAALVQDIQNILESWSEHIEKCSKMFMRVPNNYKWIFFAGKKPPFGKDDFRIRGIPFATRRATFKELENVHRKLSTVIIEEKYLQRTKEMTNKDRLENNKEKIARDRKVTEDLENSREISVDEISTIAQETDNVEDQSQCQLENSNDSVKKKPKNERISKKENQKTKMEQKKKEVIPKIWIELYEAVDSGNVEKTRNIMEEIKNQDSLKHEYHISSTVLDSVEESRTYCTSGENNSEIEGSQGINNKEDIKDCKKLEKDNIRYECVQDILNQSFESYDETLLHLASRLGQADIVNILLEAGGNPTIKSSEGRLPYNVAKDKETRNIFRRFMAAYPDKYDYNEARIPSALTTEMEEKERQKAAEKKKAQSKARKQRVKEKKAEERQKEEEKLRKEKEENEKKWFQNLSDREKRAVAAERRLG